MATKKYVSLDKLGLYDEKIKKVITDGDAASLQSANAYADSLASNYEAAGSVNTAKTELEGKITAEENRAKGEEARIEGLVTTAQGEVDALELVVAGKAAQTDLDALAGKVGEVPEGSTVMGIITNIQENAYDDTELRGLISGLDSAKADKTQVATDIAEAVKAEEDARKKAVQAVQDEVDALEGVHATDKAVLEGAIALKADQTTLDAVSAVANAAVKQSDYDVKVKALEDEDARIVGLVESEAERAAGIEAGLEERLVEVETFFKTAEGQTIDEALDTLVELQTYLNGEGAVADQMLLDIAANKKAIEDHVATDHDFASADEAVKEELMAEINKKANTTVVEGIDGRLVIAEGKITSLEGEVDTLQDEMDDVEAAVATKAEAQALDDAVAALEGADAGQVERIAALEAKFGEGEGNVEDMIANAKQEAIDAAAGDATTKANKAESNAKAYTDTEVGKDRTRLDALEADTHTHANKALLDTYTQTEANLADAVAKKHAHSNMDVLEAITAAKVAAWDAAEQAAKTYADGLNTAMDARMVAVETWQANMVECSETDIADLFA